MNENLSKLYDVILNGNVQESPDCVQAALDDDLEPERILNESMIAAMQEVGQLYEKGEYFVPEMLVSARAMQLGLDVLRPHLVSSGVEPVGKVAIGTIRGDLHDIGKNLVSMMLEGAGFEIIDLGTNVPPERFVAAVQNDGVDIVGLSALLTTTMPKMRLIIKAIEEAGIRGKVKIIVGGAPLTDEFAKEIGADGYAPDASQATKLALSLLE
jgi:5-methyltetrahydrofolate--homocysteine methyltransferase